MQRSDVAVKVPRLSFQPVHFFGILLLLHLQFRYFSETGTKKRVRNKKKPFYTHLLILSAHLSLSARASVTFFISVLKKSNI